MFFFYPPLTGYIVTYPLAPLFLPEITLWPLRIFIYFAMIFVKAFPTYTSIKGHILSKYYITVTYVPSLA